MEKTLAYLPELAKLLSFLIIGIALIAFFVTLIVQAIKDTSPLQDKPTKLVTLILSVLLTVLVLFATAQIICFTTTWYMVAAAVVIGFIVYAVATGGWKFVHDIWLRVKPPDNNYLNGV